MTESISPSITIITSIPPTCPFREIDSRELSKEYRASCVDSWKRFGDRIVSVNNSQEAHLLRGEIDGVDICTVESNGCSVSGRPLVLFEDLLCCAANEKSEIIALTNSDIFFANAENLKRQACLLNEGEAIVSRRINVQSLQKNAGTTYQWGYDLFVLHRKDIEKIYREKTMFFGEPWWDYYFLSNIILNGITIKTVDSLHVLHVSHKEAYFQKRWLAIGKTILKNLVNNIEYGNYASNTKDTLYFRDFVINSAEGIRWRGNVQRVLSNKKAAIAYLANTFFQKIRLRKEKQQKELDNKLLYLFSCKLIIFSEIIIQFGCSSSEDIKKSCSELRERIRSIAR